MKVQACIPPALCTIHNFIRIHDPNEIHDFDIVQADPGPGQWGELALGPPTCQERVQADKRWDRIVQAMWISYQGILQQGKAVNEEL